MTPVIGSGSKPVYVKFTAVTASTAYNPNSYRSILLNERGSGEPLDEMWTPDKIVAYRVIPVEMLEGIKSVEPRFVPIHHHLNVNLQARCRPHISEYGSRKPCTDIPGEDCPSTYGNGCGYYAYKSDLSARQHVKENPCQGQFAVVKVLLSGKVIEHEKGYRAEILNVTEILDVYECGVLKRIPVPRTDVANFKEPTTFDIAVRIPYTTEMTSVLLPRPPGGYRHPTPPSPSV